MLRYPKLSCQGTGIDIVPKGETIWRRISFATRFVELPSFLIVFAPRPFTLSVAVPVFARFAFVDHVFVNVSYSSLVARNEPLCPQIQ